MSDNVETADRGAPPCCLVFIGKSVVPRRMLEPADQNVNMTAERGNQAALIPF